MKKKIYLALLLAFSMVAASCSNHNNSSKSTDGSVSADPENTRASENDRSESLVAIDNSKIFSDLDYDVEYDESKNVTIQLTGDTANCSSDTVQASGSTVTITDEGTYLLSGTLDDGMIIINTDKKDKVQIILDNVTIYSKTSAPIYIPQSDKVFITMAPGSTNTLSNGGTYTAFDKNNIDAVIFSKEDVTLNGAGTLIISSPGGHGIVSKNSLKITSGSYDINCASHGISGKDDICITNADFTIVSGKDGIHAENVDDNSLGYVYIQSGNIHISAEGDGITTSSLLQIEDGDFAITAGGGNVNASSHHFDSWGNFPGAGRHREDKSEKDPSNMSDNPGKRGENPPDISDDSGKRGENPPDMSDDPGKKGENPPDMSDNPGKRDENLPDSTDDSSDSTSMKGLKAVAGLVINGGTFTIDSADDSFHSNGSLTVNGGTIEIASGDDALHADKTLTVTDGTITITKSYEGIEGLHIKISGGDITLTASDDGLNAAGGTDDSRNTGGRDGAFGHGMSSSSDGSITISGGKIKITASGDGIDANGTLAITGGDTIVSGPTQGDTATLDYDTSGTISGGTFIGTGASGRMAQTFSDSDQGVIYANVGNQPADTKIQLSDSEGNTIITYKPELDFALVIFSSPDIISGKTYTLTVGSSSSEFTAS